MPTGLGESGAKSRHKIVWRAVRPAVSDSTRHEGGECWGHSWPPVGPDLGPPWPQLKPHSPPHSLALAVPLLLLLTPLGPISLLLCWPISALCTTWSFLGMASYPQCLPQAPFPQTRAQKFYSPSESWIALLEQGPSFLLSPPEPIICPVVSSKTLLSICGHHYLHLGKILVPWGMALSWPRR